MAALLYSLCFLPTSLATIGAGISPEGVTELFANSFGDPGQETTYNYIIVGGGTAGNTIAARRALDPANYTIAVTETGSFYEITNSNCTQVPGYDFHSALANFAGGSLQSLTHFGLLTEPQGGYNGRELMYVVGHTFGGRYVFPILSQYDWLLDEGDQEQAIVALHRIRNIALNSSTVEEEYLPCPEVQTREEILGVAEGEHESHLSRDLLV